MPTLTFDADAPAPPLGGVPVGTILAYIGPLSLLQGTGWELCDGTPVQTRDSVILGQQKPNLTDLRFLIGTDNASHITSSAGDNDIAGHNHGGFTDTAGEHQHHGTTTDANIAGFDPSHCFETRGNDCHNHTHSFTTSMDGASVHYHGIEPEPARIGANIPASLYVYWIIRVK